MKKENVQKIADLLYKEIGYMYCDNCRFNSEIKEEDTDEWGCDECHRKYNGWGISRAESERIATEISSIIRSHMDEVPDNDSGWIPVSERLPEAGDGKYYPLLNVQTSYGAVKCGFYRVRDDRWYIYEEFYNEFIETNEKEVVAWQTFPEPYKEG